MSPRRNLMSAFDSSLLNDHDFNQWNAANNFKEAWAMKDFQAIDQVSCEEVTEIYEEDTNNNMENDENPIAVDEGIDGEVVPPNDTKELSEEYINSIRPYIGKEFESQDEAYDFYNRYAGKTGFSIRRHSTNKSRVKPFEVIGRIFCCNRQGVRDPRAKPVEESTRKQADIRANCNASMMIKKRNDRWVVTRVIEEHSHKLVSPSKRHNMRSLRAINSSQKQLIVNMRLAGVKTNQMMNYLAVEAGGVRNIGFLPKDARNYLSAKRQLELKHGDAQAVLDYFERQQMENPSFFYSIQVDSEGQMTNFFWADAKCRMDYHYFGDVVCFDPTYSKNRYDMPFVPIVGVNHHHQTVLFGGALLYSESEESFVWVMKTWMRAMHDKAPKVILTDQESAIGGAIAQVLPGTRHRYCLWHICRNAMKNVSNVDKEFVSDFSKCLYGYETVEEFELGWKTMLNNHNLEKDKWLSTLYNKREHWASVYTRDIFCADMYTTQRSESINSYFDGFLKRDMPLYEFVRQFERAVVARREAENNMDYDTLHTSPVLRFGMCIEKDAASVYTKKIFTKVQEQLTECFSYTHKRVDKSGTVSTYHISRVGYQHKFRTVMFDSFSKNAKCSCLLYEFAGYLCRHILKIFVVKDVQNLPTQYVLKRWTKDAKFGPVVFSQGDEIVADCHETVTIRYSKLCQDAINIAVKGSTSIPVYNVAVQALQKALEEIEKAIKSDQVNPDGQLDVTQLDDTTGHEESVENQVPSIRRSLRDPPIVKHKGKPGRMKSWIDMLNKNRKNKETKKKEGPNDSPRIISVELDKSNSKAKQPRKRKRSVALDNGKSQVSQPKKQKKVTNKHGFVEINSHQPELLSSTSKVLDTGYQPSQRNEIDLNVDLSGYSSEFHI